MAELAFTRASTIGPIAEAVESAGGSIARVFRKSELPLRLLERPDHLMLLRDQFRLVEHAAREVGDDALPARLSTAAGIAGLGPYGRHLASFSRLGCAITDGYSALAPLLQAATHMEVRVDGRWARWTYSVTEPIVAGRQKNELLAIGYMLDLLRHFTGERWSPARAELPGRTLQGRASVEAAFRCEMASGDVAAVVFPAELLDMPNPKPVDFRDRDERYVPAPDDFLECVAHVILLGLLDGRPGIDWTAQRLGLSRRTLQRQLADRATTFDSTMRRVLMQQALRLLGQQRIPVTEVAYELGYSDPAHFTRAFQRWMNETPRNWRAAQPHPNSPDPAD